MTLTELAVKRMIQSGATEAEAYMQKARLVRVNFAEKIENFKTAETIGITLRATMGKRLAMYSTSVLDEKEVNEAASRVVRIAKVTPEDPNWRHMNKKFGSAPAKGYCDETIKNLESQQIVEHLKSAIDRIVDYDKRVKPALSALSASSSNVTIENCYGERLEREETSILVSLSAKAEENAMISNARDFQEAKFWKEIDFETLAENAAEKAIKFLKAKPMQSSKTSVIIRNQAFANILGGMLGYTVNAESVQGGRSPLVGKIGAQVASENINIIDDGFMQSGWSTRPFDDEGHATQKTMVIEKGVLKNYLYDTYTSLKDNVESTGNSNRPNYWTRPQPSPNNFVLKTGNISLEELIHDIRNGIYVEETIGEWLSDPVSGNLNATINQGYAIKNGELAQPIKGMVISANFYELIKNEIELVGNDLKNNTQYYSPSVKIRELTVAGEN